MTLAPEHIVLGHAGTRFQTPMAVHQSTRDERREESEVWQFTSAFLVPTFLARSCRSIDEIREKFGLSHDAAEVRFDQLAPLISQAPPPSQRWSAASNNVAQEIHVPHEAPKALSDRPSKSGGRQL